MKIKILEEAGFGSAMRGLARSFNRDPKDMPAVALGLAGKDKGHNKFLESIVVWMDVEAPLDFHKQLDTYRVGITKQSDSTMHTLMRRPLVQADFEEKIPESYLNYLNSCIEDGAPLQFLSKMLPQGFIQGRTVCVNYKTIRNIILQRRGHKLKEWSVFNEEMKKLKYYEYLGV